MHMHACIHAYIRTCIRSYMHAYIHTYIHAYMNIHYIHAYMHAYIRTHVYTYIHTFIHIHIYMHTYRHTFIHTFIHACMHACIRACMHTYMHAYMHTYIHTNWRGSWRGCRRPGCDGRAIRALFVLVWTLMLLQAKGLYYFWHSLAQRREVTDGRERERERHRKTHHCTLTVGCNGFSPMHQTACRRFLHNPDQRLDQASSRFVRRSCRPDSLFLSACSCGRTVPVFTEHVFFSFCWQRVL